MLLTQGQLESGNEGTAAVQARHVSPLRADARSLQVALNVPAQVFDKPVLRDFPQDCQFANARS
jgi:hypothetical protein